MIIVLYIYLAINFMLIGSYLLNVFNDDKTKVKVLISVLLFFFGGILGLYMLTIGRKVERMFNKWREKKETKNKEKYATKEN